MFLSAIIPLTALATTGQSYTGRQALAAVLSVIGRADAALAAGLHTETEQRRPMTVSPLLRGSSRPRWQVPVEQGQEYLIRLTSLDGELSRRLCAEILPGLPSVMRIGRTEFQVGQPLTDEARHPWARHVSAEALYDKWFRSTAPPTRRIDFDFITPTAMKHQAHNLVLPLPRNVFYGYLRAWNQFAQPALADDLIDLIERDLVTTRYRLETVSIDMHESYEDPPPTGERQRQLGFVGQCAFTCFGPERALWRTLHLLADFAFFCGTGYKTTQGMGQTRKLAGQQGATR